MNRVPSKEGSLLFGSDSRHGSSERRKKEKELHESKNPGPKGSGVFYLSFIFYLLSLTSIIYQWYSSMTKHHPGHRLPELELGRHLHSFHALNISFLSKGIVSRFR